LDKFKQFICINVSRHRYQPFRKSLRNSIHLAHILCNMPLFLHICSYALCLFQAKNNHYICCIYAE
jgi:hypothetical protein